VCGSQWLLAAVHSVLQTSQRELICCLLFPSWFINNPKFRQAYCSACHLISLWFLVRLIPRLWRWRRYVPPKRRLTFNGLHSSVFQKTECITITVLRTSNPTYCIPIFFQISLYLCFNKRTIYPMKSLDFSIYLHGRSKPVTVVRGRYGPL
jgi:hypothetical protein